MRIARPKTLLSLTLVGLGLLTLPLLLAVGNAMLKLGNLVDESASVTAASQTSTREFTRVQNALRNMERQALLYLALQDRGMLDPYATSAAELAMSLGVLENERHPDSIAPKFAELRRTLGALTPRLSAASGRPSREEVENEFQALRTIATTIGNGMRETLATRQAALEADARSTRRALLWQAAALIPGTLILVLFFIVLVGRPMRQIDRAIRELGKGDFSHPIAVSGPTDIETLGRQLEWLRNRLAESTEEKNKFLRHMSHELKTPLANIREGTELLLDGSVGELDRQQEEVTGILRENSVKLQRLIENLLTFSAWQAKTASLEISEFELKPFVFGTLSQHRLAISNRGIKLEINVAPIRVLADEVKLRLVLENLISNALKFTPESGQIAIRAEMDGTELVIEVADSGPGIAAEDEARIFEAFYQGRRLQGGPVGGTGIGLSVVHECVQAHGGRIELNKKSPLGGAHFIVHLPLRRASDKPRLAVANG